MKREAFSTNLWIKPNRSYPTNELFEIMKENLGDKFGPFELKKVKVFKTELICAQGTDKYEIRVQTVDWKSRGGRIIIRQYKPLKQAMKDSIILTIICVITLGIGFAIWRVVDKIRVWFGLEGTKANRARMRALGEEIEKLVSK
jgi:hypothetical protein